MKVTIQYYDGPPPNATRLASDAKRLADQTAQTAAKYPKSEGAKKAAAAAAEAAKKAADDVLLEPTPGLREAVKEVADQHGLVVTTIDPQHETIGVSGSEQAKVVMLDLAPIANIQLQTAA